MQNKIKEKICKDKLEIPIVCPKLYKFRALQNCHDLSRIKDIINDGFYCNDFLNFNDMNEGVYTHNKDNNHITLDEKQKYKICSFSGEEALNSELMWGHYSNAGKGVAIEIIINDAKDLCKIKYIDTKEKLSTIEDVLTRKSTDWEYEKEWRYLSTSGANPIIIGKITKIYFGTPYKNLSNYDEIKEKHTTLIEYLKFKEELEKYCKEKDIECVDYDFSQSIS
jgi:hypothetical protein